MHKKENHISVAGAILLILVFLNAAILKTAFIKNETWYLALLITLPLVFIAGIKLIAEKKVSSKSFKHHENYQKQVDDYPRGLYDS